MSERLMGSISIAATFTAEPLSSSLSFLLEHLGIPLEIHYAPYGQLFQQLLSNNELLARNARGINVILVRLEDFVRDVVDQREIAGIIGRTADELETALSTFARRASVPSIIAILPASGKWAYNFSSELQSASARLLACARSLPGMIVLSSEDIDRVSSGSRHDAVSDDLAHVPYTMEHYSALGLAIVRKVHAALVPAQKVLALDCDNTIWRGVVGEDGVDGVIISPAFAELQRFAVAAHRQGALICLVSKNAERDVLEVFEKRSDMILALDQVVAHRINWNSKPQSIRELAQSLNLGLESFVFLDDNPVECALMKAELPQVVTLQVPAEDELSSFLSGIWAFDKISVTDEDLRRTQMYKENAAREQFETSSKDIGDFIASLEVVTDIQPPAEAEWPRLSQLTQRTNQFNFSTVRRTEPELHALANAGAAIMRVNVKDRFGDYGLVGLMIARYEPEALTVDTLLLSCRVLGRGVEHAMLRALGGLASARGISLVVVPVVPTPKNEPARAFIESVAHPYRRDEADRIVFSIPADQASSIAHRPGHDPIEVVNASKSTEKKVSLDSGAASVADRSQRYAVLAHDFTTGAAVVVAAKSRLTRTRDLPGEATPPTTHDEHRMLALWEEVLAVRDLGIDDDYFAAGGTSLLAATIFAEIARRFGVKLPLTTILSSPTVRSLSRHVGEAEVGPVNALLELKQGNGRNLFLVHDGDGETLLYANLAYRLPEDIAVFAINPRSVRNVPLAHASIEQMAEFYLGRIREKQPHGPYYLGGMCAGGVIAFEMAKQLVAQRETVQLVALLDAATPQAARRRGRIAERRFRRFSQVFEQTSRELSTPQRLQRIVGVTSKKAVNALSWEIASRIKKWSVRARFELLRHLVERDRAWPGGVPALSVRQIYECAEAAYIPGEVSATNILLVRATHGEAGDTPYAEIYSDPTFGWGTVAPRLTMVDVEGGHFTMLQEPAVGGLARALVAALAPAPKAARPVLAVEEPA